MHSAKGFTLVELLFATGLLAVLAAAAAPQLVAGLDEWQTLGAVRYLSSRLYQARMEAAVRNADTAVRFVRAGSSYSTASSSTAIEMASAFQTSRAASTASFAQENVSPTSSRT